MKVAIVYGTIEGQTGKVARFVSQHLKAKGHEVRMFDAKDHSVDIDIADAEKVILAGSVHERRHPEDFEVYLMAQRDALNAKESLLLSVSLSAAFKAGREEAQDYVTELSMRTGVDPTQVALVAGAVRSRKYDYFSSMVLRHVVLRDRPSIPADGTHEFTDWDQLRDAVDTFVGAAA
jgi:menaquinone-dependent protoporphyrinogen oxidase